MIQSVPAANPILHSGLSFLTVWKLRSPRLPLAVECTGELVRASLELGDTNSIISTYCLAIIRFVNGYTDKAQAGLFARPTLALGSSLGIKNRPNQEILLSDWLTASHVT